MSRPKHTPGPWMIFEGGDIGSASVRLPETTVIKSGTVKGETIGSAMCNARLIAAAPELLAALRRLLDESCPFAADADSCECGENGNGIDRNGDPCEHRQAYAAIRKATGE